MDDLLITALRTLNAYHRFDDGLVESISFSYARNQVSAEILLYGRNLTESLDTWRHVRIKVTDVSEFHFQAEQGELLPICSGVKILQFEGLICVDIDGTYEMAEDPKSLDEVRRHGTCYFIGGRIEAEELT